MTTPVPAEAARTAREAATARAAARDARASRDARSMMAAPVRRARSVSWRQPVRLTAQTGVVVSLAPSRTVSVPVARLACAIAAQATESVREYGRAARAARRDSARAERDAMAALERAERIAGNAGLYAVAGRSAEHATAVADAVRTATAAVARMESARARTDIAQRAYDAWKVWVVMPDGADTAMPSQRAIARARRAVKAGAVRAEFGFTAQTGERVVTVSGDASMLAGVPESEWLPKQYPANVATFIDGAAVPVEWADRFATFGVPVATVRAEYPRARSVWTVDATRSVIDAVRRETVKAAALRPLTAATPGTPDARDGADRRVRNAERLARKAVRNREAAMRRGMTMLSHLYASA